MITETRSCPEFINLNSLVLTLATELLQFHLVQAMHSFQNLNIKPADKSEQNKSKMKFQNNSLNNSNLFTLI